MARNSSGTWSNPTPTAVGGQSITAADHNNLVADIGAELTDSASRSGKGGFTAPVRGPDGALGAPALSFTSETGSGLYRVGAGSIGFAVLGVLRTLVSAAGHAFTSAVADGASAVAHVFDTTTALANASAKLASFRNAGVEKAYLTKDGKGFFAGVDAGGASITNAANLPIAVGRFHGTAGGLSILQQIGSVTFTSPTRSGAGWYTVALAGCTANAIAVAVENNGAGLAVSPQPSPGVISIFARQGYSGTTTDTDFSLIVFAL